MKSLLLIMFAACALSLSAQSVSAPSVTFSMTNPAHVLTVTKSDPRDIEMFIVDLVDSEGNPKGDYIGIVVDRIAPIMVTAEKQFRPPFPGSYNGLKLYVKDSKVYFVGDDSPVVKQRNADLTAGRKFDLARTMGPPPHIRSSPK
jgi:hypothetical protein